MGSKCFKDSSNEKTPLMSSNPINEKKKLEKEFLQSELDYNKAQRIIRASKLLLDNNMISIKEFKQKIQDLEAKRQKRDILLKKLEALFNN